ncbi:MAG TPA: error-prone DNA polymerase [Bryobacteraceae bacterium]|nr:error-prone DNA polymerase [Bryobacteraceae bacterium]
MTEPKFADFHACSAFSFLEGASLPEDLVERAHSLGHASVALMDRDNLCGAPRFYMAAKKIHAHAHIGAEITGEDGDTYPLLVENRTGYQNLCRLITSMKLRAPKGEAAASDDELERYAQGLVCLSGEGVYNNQPTRARFEKLIRLFGRANVYAELQRHFHRDQEARNQAAIELACSMKLPLVATNGVRHARPEERELADVLTAVRHKTTVMGAGQLLARNSERYLKSPQAMARLFSDVPEAIAETAELSARLNFTLADLGYEFPRYPTSPGETMNSFLRQRTDEGARLRFRPYHERARHQIERELALIEKLNLAGYFLIVWDLVRFCREQGILAQGRGSAANSAVCYALGITAVDPVAMELLFERFLSEERGEWPDIDLDLPSGDQRERVIQYVYQRYGERGAAMTANVITYRGRSAARDVGKALGFDAESLGRLSSLVAVWGWHDPSDTAERQFRQAGFDLADARIRKFLTLYSAVQNLPRHLGQHSGGIVICQGHLDAVVPLEPATMPGRVVIEWDKEDCADLGLVKVDLLGLGMMAVLEESLDLIRAHYPEPVDLAHLPQDDPAVYAALQKADTVGMFQVESRAQMSCLPRLKPKKFYDIVVQVAIIRPGPIVGKMLHPYLRRRQGYEEAACLHPSLETVLKRTLGVPLFQEQLLRIAMIAANFTGGEAEELRRAMGFKRSEARMRDIETRLRSGMQQNGIVGETQDHIVQSITAFALYGFPESHAASFALIAYASAYLKCHFLAAFTTAMLNNQPMGFYNPATLVKDAQRHGQHFLPVDVQQSFWKCTLEGPGARGQGPVRLGFNYVRGLRKETAEAIVAARPFTSITDLALRVPGLRKDELRMLAEIGALNSLGASNRRDALWEAERALRPAGPLFEAQEDPSPTGPRPLAPGPSPLAPMTAPERIRADFHGTGLTIGPHPMYLYREGLRARGVLPAADLAYVKGGRTVRVAGCVICRQRPGTAKGFLFLSLEDETGIANAIVEPDLFDAHRQALVTAPYLLIEGVLQNQQGAISIKLRRAEPLDFAAVSAPSHDFH